MVTPETLTSTATHAEVFNSLSPEWQRVAQLAIGRMVEKFQLSPITAAFQAFRTTSLDGYSAVAIVEADLSGIDLGKACSEDDPRRSWRGIFDEAHDTDGSFIIEIEADGYKYDCRSGMTRDVYQQMIARALYGGYGLPDSQPPGQANGIRMWTWTMLTGENRSRDCAPLVSTVNGQLYGAGTSISNGHRQLRFRPGVMLY